MRLPSFRQCPQELPVEYGKEHIEGIKHDAVEVVILDNPFAFRILDSIEVEIYMSICEFDDA